MTDLDNILSELKLRATNASQEKALVELCLELAKTFEQHAAEGVANLVHAKMQPLSDAFDNAQRTLMKKLTGGGPGVH